MIYTLHGKKRCSERGIPLDVVEIVYRYGHYLSNNSDKIILDDKDKVRAINELDKEKKQLLRLLNGINRG